MKRIIRPATPAKTKEELAVEVCEVFAHLPRIGKATEGYGPATAGHREGAAQGVREGMAIARAKGKLRGKQPMLSEKQQRELWRIHDTGGYSIGDLAELFSVSRPYRLPHARALQEKEYVFDCLFRL